MSVALRVPSAELLPDYVAALERGGSADNVRGKAAADEELERIAADPDGFLALLENPQGVGPPIKLLDGSTAPRLPSIRQWIWDEGFCGSIGLRWWGGEASCRTGSPTATWDTRCPPWTRGRGMATEALRLMLPLARARGLTWIELTTDADNPASQRVVEKNGGKVVAHEPGGDLHGGAPILR
jgi:predicted acetyltransferase